jgi:hypothetical protein
VVRRLREGPPWRSQYRQQEVRGLRADAGRLQGVGRVGRSGAQVFSNYFVTQHSFHDFCTTGSQEQGRAHYDIMLHSFSAQPARCTLGPLFALGLERCDLHSLRIDRSPHLLHLSGLDLNCGLLRLHLQLLRHAKVEQKIELSLELSHTKQ